jgi:hypothetical protein
MVIKQRALIPGHGWMRDAMNLLLAARLAHLEPGRRSKGGIAHKDRMSS